MLFSAHALRAMATRGITVDEVIDTVLHPEVSYSDPRRPGILHQRGDIAVVHRAPEDIVLTVLYRYGDAWSDQDGRPSGRTLSTLTRKKILAMARRAERSPTRTIHIPHHHHHQGAMSAA